MEDKFKNCKLLKQCHFRIQLQFSVEKKYEKVFQDADKYYRANKKLTKERDELKAKLSVYEKTVKPEGEGKENQISLLTTEKR